MENTKIIENTYLGQKGYTIPKNEISIEIQKQIRNDLTIKPVSHGAPGGCGRGAVIGHGCLLVELGVSPGSMAAAGPAEKPSTQRQHRHLGGIGLAAIVIDVDMRGASGQGVDQDRLAVIGDGAIKIAFGGVGLAAIVEGERIFRIELDRPIVVGDSVVIVALGVIFEAAVVVEHRKAAAVVTARGNAPGTGNDRYLASVFEANVVIDVPWHFGAVAARGGPVD